MLANCLTVMKKDHVNITSSLLFTKEKGGSFFVFFGHMFLLLKL